MRGLLADVNLEGHLRWIQQLLERDGLLDLLAELGLELVTLKDIGLPPEVDDRTLWQRCQHDGWVLFTDNRNDDGETSLQTTLNDWTPGKLPVLTLANKRRFERSTEYRTRVAADIADVVFGITGGEYRDRDRVFVPR